MIRYTDMNTEGFTADELAILNSAFDRVAAAEPGMTEKSIDDAITNSWVEGMTVDALVSAALTRHAA